MGDLLVMNIARLKKFTQFRLPALFCLTLVVALGAWFHFREQRRITVCNGLYALDCPTVRLGEVPAVEYGAFCTRMCSRGAYPSNASQSPRSAWAFVGVCESQRYTVFMNPGLILPMFNNEPRIRKLLLELDGLQEVVICDSGYPDVLNEPHVKDFIDKLRQQRPTLRFTPQKCTCLG